MCYCARWRDCHFRIAQRSMKKAITRRRLTELTAAFAASSAIAHNVQAQAYPSRTIRLIAPFPAGGGTDSAARIIAARLSDLLGQQVIVDNRPGAGSNIGAEAAAALGA
jgi:tripartite-type tricarboxylate transporter receptor subunit TctC